MQICDIKKHRISLLDLQFISEHREHTNPNTVQAKEPRH